MKLALGTVQLGMPYGITNSSGQPSEEEAKGILKLANDNGIKLLDTAAAYGASESILGKLTPDHFEIVTKVSAEAAPDIAGHLMRKTEESLRRLCRKDVYGLLIHNSQEALKLGAKGMNDLRRRLKEETKARRFGYSVYDEEEINQLLGPFELDLVQIPFSVADQRLAKGGALRRLRDRGVEIHVRSAFLQGILLTEPAKIPSFLAEAGPVLERFAKECAKRHISPATACLAYIRSFPEVSHCVVGVTSVVELRGLLNAYAEISKSGDFPFQDFELPHSLLNPARWPKK